LKGWCARNGSAPFPQLDPIDPPAADNVLICCSQPEVDMVIDL
jgi:hypothetical protein